jgi:uncharacterized HAD superfamily protein
MNIGIDVDGVLAEFCVAFSTFLNKKYGDTAPVMHTYEVPLWDWHAWYPISKEELGKSFKEFESQPNVWVGLSLIDPEDFKWLVRFSHTHSQRITTYFVTKRNVRGYDNGSAHWQTVKWLSANGISLPQVIVTDDKAAFARDLELKFFLDDKVSTVEDIARLGTCYTYVKDAPYNRNLGDFEAEITRVHSVHAFLKDVLAYAPANAL